jgi:site-specific recombinase XerD
MYRTDAQKLQYLLGRFITWLEGHGITTLQDVTARHVRQYLAQYAGKSD